MDSIFNPETGRFHRENDEGNIEYKVYLGVRNQPMTLHRTEKLKTQMRWRLSEGNGECMYVIGLYDNGDCGKLTKDELITSMKVILSIVNEEAYSFQTQVVKHKESFIGLISIKGPVSSWCM